MVGAKTYQVTIIWLNSRGQIYKREGEVVRSHGDAEDLRQWLQQMYPNAHSVSVELVPEKVKRHP